MCMYIYMIMCVCVCMGVLLHIFRKGMWILGVFARHVRPRRASGCMLVWVELPGSW